MNKKTALIFFGIIGVGAAVSWFTLTNFGERVEVPVEEETPAEVAEAPEDEKPTVEKADPEPGAMKPKGGKKAKGKAKADATAKAETPEPEPKAEFSSPEAAMKSLAEKAKARNYEEFVAVVGEESIPESIRERVEKLIEDPAYKLDDEKPFTEISKSAKAVRWALNFVPATGGTPQQLYTDLAREGDAGKAFDVAKISFPLQLSMLGDDPGDTGDAPQSPGTADTEKPIAPEVSVSTESDIEKADALSIAHAFSKAVVNREFEVARTLSDPSKVTDERVAALMIAVEEGNFTLKQERPLVVTLSRDDITWVLTRVNAGSTDSGSEFALELGRVGEAWKVNGLTFSKVLSALAAQGGGGDVAYSPIVEDPAGGDSLVLYFEFDNEGLTSRTRRQLAIVADILGKGTDRVIRINGHADAMGTDAYNAELSEGRAASVREALISMGVSPDQIVTEGFGASKPRLPNFLPDGSDNPSGRSQNRRAEVYLDF